MGHFISNRERIQYMLTFLADGVSLVCSTLLAWLVFDGIFNQIPTFTIQDKLLFYALVSIAFLCAFLFFSQTENITKRRLMGELRLVVAFNIVLLVTLTALLVLTKAAMTESRYLILGTFLFNIPTMLLLRQLLKALLNRPKYVNNLATLVGVISTEARVENILSGIEKDWTKRVFGVALIDCSKDSIGKKIRGVRIRAVGTDFIDWVRKSSLDEIYISVPYDSGETLLPILDELESMGINIHLNIPILEKMNSQKESEKNAWYPHLSKSVEDYHGVPLIELRATRLTYADTIIKRVIDIVGGFIGLILSIPIILIISVPLLLESRGPLLFKQKRVGLNGRYFTIYKLRSMFVDADEQKKELMKKNEMSGHMFKMTDDPRVTKVGRFIRKTSIDELPQFINVLKGEMSLVGTRPPTLDEYNLYESHHKRRLSMKPGMTGLWQVSGRNDIEDFEEVVKLDVEYIDNWTFWSDIKILLKTVGVVFARKGAR